MGAPSFRIVEVDKSSIKAGYVIEHNGKHKTVDRCNIKRCNFLGITLFGDCYQLGYKKVKRVIYQEIKPITVQINEPTR